MKPWFWIVMLILILTAVIAELLIRSNVQAQQPEVPILKPNGPEVLIFRPDGTAEYCRNEGGIIYCR